MSRYDRAITVFSPDGQLLQVAYAQEAVKRGPPVIGVRGDDVVVLATERKVVEALQDERTERKIVGLDDHIALAFAGLRADARVLIARAQIECQSNRLMLEDAPTVEHVARYIALLKQGSTQSNGKRPYEVSCLVGGIDCDGPHLFQTEPSGMFYAWKACAAGRGRNAANEYLEKHYRESLADGNTGAIKLAFRSLLQVFHSNNTNFDVAVIRNLQPMVSLKPEEIAVMVKEI